MTEGENKGGRPYDLEERTELFAKRCRELIRRLPRTVTNVEDARQLVRASGSVAGNYLEANDSLSKKDFRMRIKICRKESKENMYDTEHKALFAAIRKGEPINNGDYMCKSTLVAMMCRMSAYTGKTIYWDAEGAKADKAQNPAIVLDSKEDLSPPKYEFGPLEVAPIPVPGQTKFI